MGRQVDPYAPPGAEAFSRPGVIMWFRVYAVASALLYLLVEAEILLGADWRYGPSGGSGPMVVTVVVLATLVAIFHSVAAFIPYRPWAWMLGLLSICLGLVSCTVFLSVPLLVFWLRPVTRAAFRRL